MKVERFIGYSENGCPSKVDLRLLRTTCPKCREYVEFIMLNDDFLKEDNAFLEGMNMKLRDEIHRLNLIINKVIQV